MTTRVRPSSPDWPTPSQWEALRRSVGGRLVALRSPLAACASSANAGACSEFFRELKNPHFIGDDPALTQTCGWVDAWTAHPSAYAVAAQSVSDVVAAVNFARDRNLRLVVKSGGHSYLGASSAPDSLLVWTRPMHDIVVHEAFVAEGCAGRALPMPAVSIGAGAIWMHAYDAVTTRGGRYVQGGGCVTVGVASCKAAASEPTRKRSEAGSSLLQAEIVTADSRVRTVNAYRDPELFWALKGGARLLFRAAFVRTPAPGATLREISTSRPHKARLAGQQFRHLGTSSGKRACVVL